MIQLRLTEKVRKEFSIQQSLLSEPKEYQSGLGAWTLNIFKVRNQKAVIFVNDNTLYSFIIFGLRKDNTADLSKIFLNGLFQLLDTDGFTKNEINFLTQGYEQIEFTKTTSKSVLGNVNDLVWIYKSSVLSCGGFKNADIGRIIHSLNRIPQKNIGWVYSIEKVRSIIVNA